jgi:hypothetical protein
MAITWSEISALPQVIVVGTETVVSGLTQATNIRLPNGLQPTSFTIGTGANSANKAHAGSITINANANTTVDLTSLTYGKGDSSLAKVKGWRIATNATLTVGGAASTPFGFSQGNANSTFTVAANAVHQYHEPSTNGLTTTSANNVKLTAGNAQATVTLVVFGE